MCRKGTVRQRRKFQTCTEILYSTHMIERTYTQARAELASLMDRAVDDRETVIIERRGRESVALIAADELRSLQETAHLLRSPANARRLLTALQRALEGEGERLTPTELAGRVGLDAD
jgi:antitoxin YefM